MLERRRIITSGNPAEIMEDPLLRRALAVIKDRDIREGSTPEEAERHSLGLLGRIDNPGQANAIIRAARITAGGVLWEGDLPKKEY